MNNERRGNVVAPPHPYRTPGPSVDEDEREVGPRYAAFRVHLQCPGCARPVPVNSPTLGVTCSSCGAEVALDPQQIAEFLDRFEEDHAELQHRGVTLSRIGIECALEGTNADACRRLRDADVPGWLSEACPTLSRLWVAPAVEPEDNSAIGFACPSCAFGLSIDARSERVVHCPQCRGRVFVPEPLWQELHGPARIETWIAEFRGENAVDRQRRLTRAAARRRAERERADRRREKLEAAKEAARVAAEVDRLESQGRAITVVHTLILAVAIALPWFVSDGTETALWLVGAFVVITLAGAFGLWAGGRVITRATDRQDLTFSVWFNYVFVVTMPVLGHFMGIEAAYGLKWGRYAKDFGRHANLAALNWALISAGGLLFLTSTILAFVV